MHITSELLARNCIMIICLGDGVKLSLGYQNGKFDIFTLYSAV
jgi:hypothetical protein